MYDFYWNVLIQMDFRIIVIKVGVPIFVRHVIVSLKWNDTYAYYLVPSPCYSIILAVQRVSSNNILYISLTFLTCSTSLISLQMAVIYINICWIYFIYFLLCTFSNILHSLTEVAISLFTKILSYHSSNILITNLIL